MPLSFLCPVCRTKLSVADDYQGKLVRCPKCVRVLSVPRTPASAAAPPPPPPLPAPPVRTPPPSSPSKIVAAKKPAPPPSSPAQFRAAKPAPPPRAIVQPQKPARDKKPKTRGNRRFWIITGVAAGCGVFVLGLCLTGGIVLWRLAKHSGDERQQAENSALAPEQPAQAPAEPAPRQPVIETVAHVPEGPAPVQLDAAALRRVKQATVYLRVNLPNGSAAEGSGFLCMAPQIVVTNAHVLGMLRGDSLPPTRVEVVLHSGEPEEKKTTAAVLGVDRTNDLAVLRLPENSGPLPPPLPVDSANKLIETQKVYIFGFPLGVQLGKNITVSESSVSSLRRGVSGGLSQIQVNGGMNPGNSGGPVTDTRGVVVGVSVAIIRGTQLNFAIPGDLVLQVLDGRFAASEWGAAYHSGDRVLLPVKMTCLDPLRRIRQLNLDIGTGAPGDGPRRTLAASFRDGAYHLDVPLTPGQSCWFQPVLIKASGQSERAKVVAVPSEAQIVLERKPVLLQFKPPAAAIERTLQLDSDVAVSVYQDKAVASFRERMNGKVLESLSPDQRGIGTFIRLTLADCPFHRESGENKIEPPPPAHAALKQFSPTFMVDNTNACKERGKRNFNVVDADYRSAVESMFETVCNTYESTNLPLPNRTVQPLETWKARIPMLILVRGKPQVQDIFVTCTYEGVHAAAEGVEAHLALSGVVKGRGPRAGSALGKARGQARFDVEKGFLTLVHLTISSEVENDESGVRVLVNDQSIVRRSEGNQLGIAAATRNQPGQSVQRRPGTAPTPRFPRSPPGMIRRPPNKR